MVRQEIGDEASIFVRYYIGEEASDTIKARYAQYLSLYPLLLSERDEKVLAFGLKNQWSIKFLDASLAVVSPQAELRRRLYIIFALLESDKTYAHLFLSQKRSPLYIFRLAFIGLNALIKLLGGTLLLKLVAK